MILNSFQRFIQLIHLTFQTLNNDIYVIALAYFGELALWTEELAHFGVYGMASEKLDSFVLQFDQLGFPAQEELNQCFVFHHVDYLGFLPVAFFVFDVHPLAFVELSILGSENIQILVLQ